MTTAHSILKPVIAISIRTIVEDGQDFAEYAVVLGLVVLVAAAGYSSLGTALGTMASDAIEAIVTFL